MSTIPLFREDAYTREASATVTDILPEGGIVLDRTIFYARSGGQPGDVGALRRTGGAEIRIADTVYAPDRATIIHLPEPGAEAPAIGETVTVAVDWDRRFARMRMHTALHLLSVVLPYPVTGGSIGDGEGRLDFDYPDAGLDKVEITRQLADLVARDAPVTFSWITDEELDANPGLIKTMSVKPPRGSGRVRLVAIEGIDLQPCGGTHVGRTGEVGTVTVSDIEKKGKQNRRVRLKLA